ncbi:YqjF family protein [Pseudalkalibacillus sp. R45]|uniref:YqjF family protein n=1 Tax=Pseudalkalibacillus sp. R45 TaxID=3457433 RepID=UPI003FCCBFBB
MADFTDELLEKTSHRTAPLPKQQWRLTQRWDHLLFMHFPVSTEMLRGHVPSSLELDTFEGQAWIGIIPFAVKDMRIRGLMRIPFFHSYLELNVRTYVTYKGVPGLYFFSLDANHLPVVLGTRILSLPYFKAGMSIGVEGGVIDYSSSRKGKTSTIFKGSYRSISEPFTPDEGSLTYWFLERYVLWTEKGKKLLRGDIHHERWRVTEAETSINRLMFPPFQLDPPTYTHYAASQRALLWPLVSEENEPKKDSSGVL